MQLTDIFRNSTADRLEKAKKKLEAAQAQLEQLDAEIAAATDAEIDGDAGAVKRLSKAQTGRRDACEEIDRLHQAINRLEAELEAEQAAGRRAEGADTIKMIEQIMAERIRAAEAADRALNQLAKALQESEQHLLHLARLAQTKSYRIHLDFSLCPAASKTGVQGAVTAILGANHVVPDRRFDMSIPVRSMRELAEETASHLIHQAKTAIRREIK